MALVTAVLATGASAQQGPKDREGPTTIAASIGAFSGNFNGGNLRGAISLDHYLGSFVAHAEGVVIPWRTNACATGLPRGCGERQYLLRPQIGGRFMDRDGNTHPYFGIGIAYLELGLRYDLQKMSGLDLRIVSEILGGGDGVISGGSSLNIGYWKAIR
jgi:hypothetical protein